MRAHANHSASCLSAYAYGIRATSLINLMPHSNFAMVKNLQPLVS
jgi:hypothetical protein